MMRTTRRVREWLNAPTQTPRKWVVGVTAALALTWAGGVYGAVVYVNNQRTDAVADARLAARDAALALYQAELAQFQGQIDSRVQCLLRVEGRNDLRGVLIGIYDVLEDRGSTELVALLRHDLDTNYAPIDPARCGPEPRPPNPP
jgi:hypothetical protein